MHLFRFKRQVPEPRKYNVHVYFGSKDFQNGMSKKFREFAEKGENMLNFVVEYCTSFTPRAIIMKIILKNGAPPNS